MSYSKRVLLPLLALKALRAFHGGRKTGARSDAVVQREHRRSSNLARTRWRDARIRALNRNVAFVPLANIIHEKYSVYHEVVATTSSESRKEFVSDWNLRRQPFQCAL
jgi:hypothetical protein